ncbi:MAG: DUF982 domain-containing protein [Mesorhizobium sp.]|nr:DUF982 domain-containing protein [Mesorhizobium sp.]TIL46030.1 MAG: DUF982 domain-containing protein [Mesorhizobium sp.]TIM06700.1 MAG: DUF982 domain-containing protein [Mesorhizobium sp.]
MAIHWFHPPVNIETDRPGLTYGCNNVEVAAAELMKWTKRGPKWKKAVKACMAVHEGEGTASRLLSRRRVCYAPPLIRLTLRGRC